MAAHFELPGENWRDAAEADRVRTVRNGLLDKLVAADRAGAFRDGDNRAPLALGLAGLAEFAKPPDVVGYLRNQDCVCAAGHSDEQCQPAGISPHQFDDHDPMVAGGRRMDSVDRLGTRFHGRREAEGDVGVHQVVVDRLGHADASHAERYHSRSAAHRAVAADDHEGIKTVFVIMGRGLFAHVLEDGFTELVRADRESRRVGLVRGAEDRPAAREDVADIRRAQGVNPILDQPEKAVLDAETFPAVVVHRRLGYGANDRVDSRTIASAGEDSDPPDRFGIHRVNSALRLLYVAPDTASSGLR